MIKRGIVIWLVFAQSLTAQFHVLDTVTIYHSKSKSAKITSQSYRSLNTSLSLIPSIWLVSRQEDLIQADLNVHGLTFESSRLRIGNLELYDPQTGHHNLNLPLGRLSFSITDWETESPRISPIKQKSIMTETQFIQKGQSNFISTYNEVGLERINAGFSWGELFRHIFWSYRPDSSLWVGFRHNDFDATGMYAPTSVLPFAREKTSVFMAYFNKESIEGLFRMHSDKFDFLYATASGDTFNLSNSHFSWLATMQYVHALPFISVVAGFTTDGISNNKVVENTGQPFTLRVIPKIGISGKRKFWNWRGFILWNSSSGFFLPDIEISYNKNVYVSTGYKGRYPSFNELFYSDPVHKPDTARVPEQWAFLKIGMRHNRFTVLLLGRYFLTVRDWIKQPESSIWRAGSVRNVWFAGFEALWKIKPWAHLSFTFHKFFIRDSLLSRLKYVGRSPLVKIGFVSTWTSIFYLYQPWESTKKQMILLDVHIPFRWKSWTLAMGVRNALSQYVATPWQQPQRTWFVNLTYSLKQ